MKKVKYNGALEVILPKHGIALQPGDEIEVDDDFNNDLFVLVENTEKKKGDK